MSYQNDKFIYCPYDTATWDLCVIAFELSLNMLCLSLKELLCPNLTMKFWIVDKRYTFLCSLFNLTRGYLFLVNPKEAVLLGVIPKDSHARHLLIEGLHIGHLGFMIFIR